MTKSSNLKICKNKISQKMNKHHRNNSKTVKTFRCQSNTQSWSEGEIKNRNLKKMVSVFSRNLIPDILRQRLLHICPAGGRSALTLSSGFNEHGKIRSPSFLVLQRTTGLPHVDHWMADWVHGSREGHINAWFCDKSCYQWDILAPELNKTRTKLPLQMLEKPKH